MAVRFEFDVVFVGGGIAGALLGFMLACLGVGVLILVSGPWVDRADAVQGFLAAVQKTPEAPYPQQMYAPRPRVSDVGAYYVQEGPKPFRSTYERLVGGTTWHWQGTALRHLPNDFRIKTLYGVGEDWPISYEQLEPWYLEAENEIGVAGDSLNDLGAPRSDSFPMGPIPASYLDKQIDTALRPHGLRTQVVPHARNSEPFHGRPPCCGNNTCVPICPIQAKYDASVHVKKARDAGAQIVDRAVAFKVSAPSSGLIDGIYFKRDGLEQMAKGRVFVIAAHAIETPKLLLMSRTGQHPNGIANSSDQVGRNLMDHPTQISLCLARDPVYPFRGPTEISGIEHMRDGSFRNDTAAFRMPIGNNGWEFGAGPPTTLVSNDIQDGYRGEMLKERLRARTIRQVRLAALIEQLPDANNRVSLSEQMDALGLPRPRIEYAYDDYVLRGQEEARKLARLVFSALGATYQRHLPDLFGAGHIIGTCRMGDDPRTSVADADGRTHDHPNLFLAGSSLFPTAATANPTLTIAALALRSAKAISEELKG